MHRNTLAAAAAEQRATESRGQNTARERERAKSTAVGPDKQQPGQTSFRTPCFVCERLAAGGRMVKKKKGGNNNKKRRPGIEKERNAHSSRHAAEKKNAPMEGALD
jgi:hypothetical protein